jgi:hypothetical protein
VTALFEVIDPARGAVRCRECGAEDKVELDTWLGDAGEVMGYVVCGGCGATGDVRSFPFDWREV